MLLAVVDNGVEIYPLVKFCNYFLVASGWILGLIQVVALDCVGDDVKGKLTPQGCSEGHQPGLGCSTVEGNIILITHINSIQIIFYHKGRQ